MQHSDQIARGERFEFGQNWQRFLGSFDQSRVDEAKRSLQSMLECDDLSGKNFLDIGCGSGLFSLAARQLGAKVHSFDYDPQSVGCTRELKRRFFFQGGSWKIEEGSALDAEYLKNLGSFDIVYSWGVLHHTGNMRLGLANATIPVRESGVLYIAIYNDQGAISKFWTGIKKAYCSGVLGRMAVKAVFVPYFACESLAIGLVKYRNPLGHILNYKKKRGMSIYHDWIDWLGGYPFEVARREEIISFYKEAGFELRRLEQTNRHGCNQYVFQRSGRASEDGQRPETR